MDRSSVQLWLGIAFAIGLGAALRLWFIAHAATISGDTFLYGDIALSLLQHGVYGFSQPPLAPVPTLIRLPGYPLFLMFCFRLFGAEHYTAVLYVQCALDLVACLVLGDLARRMFGLRAGMFALLLAALCPFTASYTAAAITETLTCATVTLAFYALERWGESAGEEREARAATPWNRWLWVLSAALAASILLRPDQGLLAAAVLPALYWLWPPTGTAPPLQRGIRSFRLKRTAPIVAAAVCTLLPLVPWTIRNARTFHVFQPLAPRSATDPGQPIATGFDLWYRTWGLDFASTEDIYWNYDGAKIQLADIPGRAFDSPAQQHETAAVLDDYNLTVKPTPEMEERFTALARQRIADHSLRYYVALPLGRLANMLLRPRIEMLDIPLSWWRWHEHPAQTAFALAYGALNVAYLALGSWGLYRWARRRNDRTRPIALAMIAYIVLRCALLLTLDNSEPRYTLEFFPLLVIGAAAALASKPARATADHR